MSSLKTNSASIRYVKAWLRAFSNPGFWVSTTVLGLVVVFTWELWHHPEWLNPGERTADNRSSETEPEDQPLSPEDIAAIGVDIDSLPLLVQEFKRGKAASQEKAAAVQSRGFYDEIIRQQADATKAQSSPQSLNTRFGGLSVSGNPFVPSTQNSLGGALIPNSGTNSNLLTGVASTNRDSNSTSSGTANLASPILGLTSANSGNQNQGIAPVSPLQTAIDQQNPSVSAVQTPPSTIQRPVTPQPANFTNSAGQISTPGYSSVTVQPPAAGYPRTPDYGYSSTPNTNTQANPYSYSVQPQTVPVVPAPQPLPVAPALPSGYGQYPSQVPNQTAGFNTNPGVSSTLNNSAVQPSQLNQSPFTTNRRIPGRYVGGGRINTFSNP